MKTAVTRFGIGILGFLSVLVFTQCNEPSSSAPETPSSQAGLNSQNGSLNKSAADQMLLSLCDNSDAEAIIDTAMPGKPGLIYMREEEKLARDVYIYMNNKWNKPVFKNITSSEQVHMDAIKCLLKNYLIEDPVGSNGTGVFSNSHLQELYNQLVARGEVSLIEALKTGAAIEEIDILDIRNEMAINNGYADILRVYTNLSSASVNHLKAFVFNLKMQGIIYAPQFMTQQEFDALMAS